MDYVTGSSGFIGSHLTKALKSKDIVTIPHKDITSFKYKPFKNFYFLSAYGNMFSHTEDEKIIQANVLDLIHVINQVKDFNFKSFVFMSTSSVRLKIQTMYSRTKRASEEILLSIMEKYKTPICIVRPLSVTGVGEQSEHLIPTLIRSCFEGEEVDFVPWPTHDFLDVDDLVNGLIALSEKQARGIYELGTGEKYSNRQVLPMVEKATGKKANVKQVSGLRSYDTTEWYSLNFKARRYGWTPKKTLEDSIKEQVEAYKKENKRK